jgi:hypothetical protein
LPDTIGEGFGVGASEGAAVGAAVAGAAVGAGLALGSGVDTAMGVPPQAAKSSQAHAMTDAPLFTRSW